MYTLVPVSQARRSMGPRRRSAAVVALALAASAAPLSGQGRIIYQVHHGSPSGIRITARVDNGTVAGKSETRLEDVVAAGREVCFEVTNPNPALYTYGLASNAAVTPAAELPTGGLVSFLKNALPVVPANVTKAASADPGFRYFYFETVTGETQPDPKAWFADYVSALSDLGADVEKARNAARQSDLPDSGNAEGGTGAGTGAGYGSARQALAALGSGAGRFNDGNLETTLLGLYKTAQSRLQALPGASGDTAATYLLEVLRTHGESLANTRNQIRTAFAAPADRVLQCKAVGAEPVTLSLRIDRRDPALAKNRAVGDSVVRVAIRPAYVRPWLEVMPVAYSVFSRNVPEFDVQDGMVTRRDDGEQFEFRTGGMLALRVLELGETREAALHIGAGSNLLGGGKALSEFYVGALFTYRDGFRIGLGWGQAQMPDRLKSPAKVGDPLPAGLSLKDAIIEDDRSAFFLIFNLADLSLPIGRSP